MRAMEVAAATCAATGSATQQAWETWILFVLEAVRTTAEWTTAKIHAIREILDETAGVFRRRMPRIYSRELAEVIFVDSYCCIGLA